MISLHLLPIAVQAAPRAAAGRPARQRDIAQAVLDRLGMAAILVAPDRRILHLNKAAQTVLQRGDGLVVRTGLLGCADPAALPHLVSAIAAAAERGEACAVVLERSDAASYELSVAPLDLVAGEGALILFADPGARDDTQAARLRAMFALTAAEAELAAALARGQSIAALAERRGVTVGTVRIQIKSIAAKMHCRRQAEIVAVVARLPLLNAQE